MTWTVRSSLGPASTEPADQKTAIDLLFILRDASNNPAEGFYMEWAGA